MGGEIIYQINLVIIQNESLDISEAEVHSHNNNNDNFEKI